mmetsp:Transcript_6959/g.15035  ORF Transcript_6959/g.15035 Transcript_6959/m.15035 type:complete len:194 (-) Transcript_6959:601-1182(-)
MKIFLINHLFLSCKVFFTLAGSLDKDEILSPSPFVLSESSCGFDTWQKCKKLNLPTVANILCKLPKYRKKCKRGCSSREYVDHIVTILEEVSGEGAFDGSDLNSRKAALNFILEERFCGEASRIKQRYIAALFYFSTGGDTWETKGNWLSNANECTWSGLSCDNGLDILRIKRSKFCIIRVLYAFSTNFIIHR